MSKLYTITELAERLSVHPDSLRRWEKLGKLKPIKTLGGHRRYIESDVEHLLHQMKFSVTYDLFSEENNAWARKERFIYWKQFVDKHHYNFENCKDIKEISKRNGTEMVIELLDSLSDDGWKSIDEIDKTLKPIYSWYKKYHFLHATSKIPQIFTKEEIKEALKGVDFKIHTDEELQIIGYKLDGIAWILWGSWGIGDGSEKHVLKGEGIFPHERYQLELDIKNGWDGKVNRNKWRQQKSDTELAVTYLNKERQEFIKKLP